MKIIIENRTKLMDYKATRLVADAMNERSWFEDDSELRAHEVRNGIFVSSVTNKQSIRYVIWEKQHEKID